MKKLVFTLLCVLLAGAAVAQEKLCIASQGKTASIVVDNADWKGVIIAARNLADDVRKVTGTAAQVNLITPNSAGKLPHERKNLSSSIIAGTIGISCIIDQMIKTGKVPSKKIINEEKGFDAKTITQADIDTYGLK